MARLAWRKPLKIGKSERYGLDISSWLGTDSLISYGATPPAGGTIAISDVVYIGGVISCVISGATETGHYELDFNFSTPDRSDCQIVRLTVEASC